MVVSRMHKSEFQLSDHGCVCFLIADSEQRLERESGATLVRARRGAALRGVRY
jgi:hypothetical protein